MRRRLGDHFRHRPRPHTKLYTFSYIVLYIGYKQQSYRTVEIAMNEFFSLLLFIYLIPFDFRMSARCFVYSHTIRFYMQNIRTIYMCGACVVCSTCTHTFIQYNWVYGSRQQQQQEAIVRLQTKDRWTDRRRGGGGTMRVRLKRRRTIVNILLDTRPLKRHTLKHIIMNIYI